MLRKGDEPIPGYRLERFLGRGQYGEVWRASAPGRTKAALKFIDLSGNQGLKELRGVMRVKEIRHAHLMPITALWMLDDEGNILAEDSFEDFDITASGRQQRAKSTMVVESARPTTLVVAMLLGDMNLLDRLNIEKDQGGTGIPVAELLRYIEESAKGIDFLNTHQHDLGDGPVTIQHCDIKPANIMLSGNSVQICDYGLARMLGDTVKATATGMVGSPAYMAPECIRRKPSHTTDQYSLAITYVELRTGELPFEDQSYVGVLEAHQKGELLLNSLPDLELQVIRKATAIDPESRYESSYDLACDLRMAVAKQSGEFDPAATPLRASSPIKQTVVKRSTARQTAARRSTIRGQDLSDAARETAIATQPVSDERGKRGYGRFVAPGVLFCLIAAIAFALIHGPTRAQLVALLQSKPDVEGEGTGEQGEQGEEGEQSEQIQESEQGEQNAEKVTGDSSPNNGQPGGTEKPTTTPGKMAPAIPGDPRKVEKPPKRIPPKLPSSAQLALELKAAEKLLELERFVEAREKFGEIRKQVAGVPKTKRVIYLGTDNGAALGMIRVDACQPEPDWGKTRENLDEIDADTLNSEQHVHHSTLRILADAYLQAGDGKATMLVNVKRLVELVPQRSSFSHWELDQLLRLLLLQAERQREQGEYEPGRETLGCATEWVSTGPVRQRVDEALVLNQLADVGVDAQPALASFVDVALKSGVPERFVAALVGRVDRDPAALAPGVENLTELRDRVGTQFRAAIDPLYADLLARRLVARLADPEIDFSAFAAECNSIRSIDPKIPIINACWVESKLATEEDGKQWSRREWAAIRRDLDQAENEMKDGASSVQQAYVQFVQALVEDRSSSGSVAASAERILKTKTLAPQVFQVVRRKAQAADIMVRAAKALDLPDDDQLGSATPRLDEAFVYLGAAIEFQSPPSLPTKAAWTIAASHLPNSDEATLDRVGQWSDELLGNTENRDALQRQNSLASVFLVNARSYARRGQAGDAASLQGAWMRYAALAKHLDSAGETPKVDIYRHVIHPGLSLIPEDDAQTLPDKAKRAAARLLAYRGQFVLRDMNVEQLVKDEFGDALAVARNSFDRASRLSPQAEYFVGHANTLMRMPYVDRKAQNALLEKLVSQALALDSKFPGALALQGYTQLLRSRVQPDLQKRRQLLETSIDSYTQAAGAAGLSTWDQAMYCESLSAANLEAAFVCHKISDLESHRNHLDAAEALARKAIEIKPRSMPENAYNNLGNALEDRGKYLGELERFDEALQVFDKAVQEATLSGRDWAKPLFNQSRARIRRAKYGKVAAGELAAEFDRARKDLEEGRKNWRMLNEEFATDETQDLIAEVTVWISETYRMQAILASDRARRRDLLLEADREISEGAELAYTVKSLDWPTFQIESVKMALERAAIGDSEDAARDALQRAEKLVTEVKKQVKGENSLGYPISPTLGVDAIEMSWFAVESLDEKLRLIEDALKWFSSTSGPDDVERANLILLHSLAIIEAAKVNEKVWAQNRQECLDRAAEASRIGDGTTRKRLIQARRLTLYGYADMMDFQQKFKQLGAAEIDQCIPYAQAAHDHFAEALSFFGPQVSSGVETPYPDNTDARIGLANANLIRRAGNPQRAQDLDTEALEVLAPMKKGTVSESKLRQADELRTRLR